MSDTTMNLRNAASALSAAADSLLEMANDMSELQARVNYLETRISKEENFKRKLTELLRDEGY